MIKSVKTLTIHGLDHMLDIKWAIERDQLSTFIDCNV